MTYREQNLAWRPVCVPRVWVNGLWRDIFKRWRWWNGAWREVVIPAECGTPIWQLIPWDFPWASSRPGAGDRPFTDEQDLVGCGGATIEEHVSLRSEGDDGAGNHTPYPDQSLNDPYPLNGGAGRLSRPTAGAVNRMICGTRFQWNVPTANIFSKGHHYSAFCLPSLSAAAVLLLPVAKLPRMSALPWGTSPPYDDTPHLFAVPEIMYGCCCRGGTREGTEDTGQTTYNTVRAYLDNVIRCTGPTGSAFFRTDPVGSALTCWSTLFFTYRGWGRKTNVQRVRLTHQMSGTGGGQYINELRYANEFEYPDYNFGGQIFHIQTGDIIQHAVSTVPGSGFQGPRAFDFLQHHAVIDALDDIGQGDASGANTQPYGNALNLVHVTYPANTSSARHKLGICLSPDGQMRHGNVDKTSYAAGGNYPGITADGQGLTQVVGATYERVSGDFNMVCTGEGRTGSGYQASNVQRLFLGARNSGLVYEYYYDKLDTVTPVFSFRQSKNTGLPFTRGMTCCKVTGRIWVCGDNRVVVLRNANLNILADVTLGAGAHSIMQHWYTKDLWISCSDAAKVYVVDFITFAIKAVIDVGLDPHELDSSMIGECVVVANTGSDTLTVIDDDFSVRATVATNPQPWGVAAQQRIRSDSVFEVSHIASPFQTRRFVGL